jgi:hypothetical protein
VPARMLPDRMASTMTRSIGGVLGSNGGVHQACIQG